MLALPYRHGGLGIRNPVVVCDEEYRISQEITKPLVDLIVRQEMEIRELDEEVISEKKKREDKNKGRVVISERRRIFRKTWM